VTLTSTGTTAGAARPTAALPLPLYSVELAYGLREVGALDGELTALAAACGAPLTARPAWLLAACAATRQLEPWVLIARDASGTAVGAAVLVDQVDDRRTRATALGGTDGGHRGALLTGDPVVAHALGESWHRLRLEQHRPAPVALGPLPAGDPVVAAFAAGLPGSWQEATASIPVIVAAVPGSEPGGEYLAAGMRRTLRKAANRLAADGSRAVHRFTADPAEIRDLLPQLEQVYRHRDHVHGRASDLDDAARQQTWRHRVRDLAEAGVLELGTLHVDGELAAYTLGIRDAPTYRLLEGRFVTRFARYSPGRLLEALVVERALATAGFTTFDWMTAVAPESLLGRNDADPMVLLRLG
jgi:CelD/BcsL family acetyltransferase involved in cellulose biosynthesis